ncbi:unnamed protein product [Gordionus sp. m RMFG-2023]
MNHLTSWMNLSIDPCTDYYEFACGGYIQKTSIPSGFNKWGQFDAISESILVTIKDILENPHTKYEARAERLAKTYYDSCMDETNIREKLGGKPLTDLLDLYGGWDVLNVDNKSSPFIEESSNLKKIRYPKGFIGEFGFIFFNLDTCIDPKNSSKYILCIYPGKRTLPYNHDYDGNSSSISLNRYDAYLKYMMNIGNLLVSGPGVPNKTKYIYLSRHTLGKPHSQTTVNNPLKTVMSNVLEFEEVLSSITPSSLDLKTIDESNYVLMSLKELDKNFDFMNWTRHIHQFFQVYKISTPVDQVFWVKSISYMEKMNSLIKRSLNEMHLSRVLHDYIMWHSVESLASYLSKNFSDARDPVQKADNIKNYENLPAWKKCLQNFPTFMEFPLSSLYLKSNFDSSDKIKVERMVDSLKAAYKETFRNLDWMDETTKSKSMEKVDAINAKIGYPEYIVDPKELDKDYEGLYMQDDSYFKNYLSQRSANDLQEIKELFAPVDKKHWFESPHTSNAFYSPSENQIVFPAGILRKPFYDKTYPDSYQFGAIGSVITHEIGHGFDDEGRKYDKSGNWNLWWTNKSIEAFVKKTVCYLDQYSNYSIDGHKLDGKRTLGENIADNGGVAISLKALKSYQARKKRDEYALKSDTLEDRLFFLAYAQSYCSKDTPESLYESIKSDSHSPDKYRVNGVLSNFKQFSEAYSCSAKSAMNPSNKCIIW